MSSVAVQVMPSPATTFSKDSLIANKLASDLDAKLVSSSKKVLLQRIEFKPASKPDEQYENLKKKYVPLNSQSSAGLYANTDQHHESLRSPTRRNTNDDLPTPKVVLFPSGKVELNWKQVRRVGPGLNNMGNTCFLNSVLQVLTYTPPLVNYLASREHIEKCRSVGFCMLCELQKHIVRSFGHHQGEAIKPMAIIQKLKFIAKHLRFGQQEDAHEFLRYVIDGMQKSCLAAEGYTEKLDRMSKQTTMVHQVFGGYYRSQVQCLKCKNNSNTFDPLMDIMLDIKTFFEMFRTSVRNPVWIRLPLWDTNMAVGKSVNIWNLLWLSRCFNRDLPKPELVSLSLPLTAFSKHKIWEAFLGNEGLVQVPMGAKALVYNKAHVPSVEKALQRSIKLELLDGENLYMCPRCKRKVPAHKQFLIHRAPNVLTLQLKRFDYNQIFGGKISKQVEYTEYLDLRPYMTSKGPPIRYCLYAVLVHSGYSSNSGHYYCYIRASNGVWYQMNDSIVRQVALKAVLSQQAYLLFYSRVTSSKQELQSQSVNSPKPTPLPKSPVTPVHLPKVIKQNDVGTPAKPGIVFHRTPSTTFTMTKPSTMSTKQTSSIPLAAPSERPKFAFTIPMKNKGLSAAPGKAKSEGRELAENDVKSGAENKVKSSSISAEHAQSDLKSPITSSVKKLETVTQLETTQTAVKVDSIQKEKPSVESLPLKKEGNKKSDSPTNKPRPPPLFIPRPVSQGRGTPSSATRATTPWKVTPKTTTEPQFGPMSPPPLGSLPPQQSPSSAMSDTSSTSSVMGKTGEWMVTDKTVLTPGPRLPERQHAGWQVSEKAGICNNAGGVKKSDGQKKKKKHKKEKKKRKEKSKKKYTRLQESDGDDHNGKKKVEKKDKPCNKQQKDTDNQENSKEETSKGKKHKRKHKACDDEENKVVSSKRPCLVAYDDSSSSSSNEQVVSNRKTGESGNSISKESSAESRVPVVYDDDNHKKNHATRRATWNGSQDSSTVSLLVSGGKGLHGYGSSVVSWEGGENIVDSNIGEPSRKRQRRDSWDDEYDRGKEKRVKKNKDTRQRRWNGNPFQREHEKRNTKQGFKDRISRQFSKNHHSYHKSHSSRKYRRFSN